MYSVLRTRILYDTPALSKVVSEGVLGEGREGEVFMNIYPSIHLFIYLFCLYMSLRFSGCPHGTV